MTELQSAPNSPPAFDPCPRIAEELAIPLAGTRAVAKLLEAGGSVPFIARYRKEQTGGLDEVQIRDVEEKRLYYTELFERRQSILAEIEKQGKLTDSLRATIEQCWVKTALEDIYLPFKPKRRTRAIIARERGLEPLALRILEQPATGDPLAEAAAYVDVAKEVPDVKAALAGARDIVAEKVAERVDVRAKVRDTLRNEGSIIVEAVKDKTNVPTKFEAYYEFQEKVMTIPSHRYLAIRRGESEGILRAHIDVDDDALIEALARIVEVKRTSPFAEAYQTAIRHALLRLLGPSLENDLRVDLKLIADREAVEVFAENLRRLLLSAPLGRRVVLGIDPGQRSGCKVVVIDDTGKLVTHTLINLVMGDSAQAHAKRTLLDLLVKYSPFAVAVGNGTHGRETEDFVRAVLKEHPEHTAMVVLVSESGASVYSASDVAREEFPDLDLTIRGAISIARRLQDPLAELVKIDPKAIGVGQYQHDVFQPLLKRKLDEVIESCVNAVGVELNTASAPLLSRVAGLSASLATRIVKYRETNGAFRTRHELTKVSGFGPKAFEQCAGFVRIREGTEPLDASAVHPERYELVARIAQEAGLDLRKLIGDQESVRKIAWGNYVSADVGVPTLEDIQKELVRPGRDPRDVFEAPKFRDDVRTLEDLKLNMILEGVVTNVTAFGAFVDVGVHQDGLIHVSQLADRFVKDPHAVVKVGDTIKVRVLEVDLPRKRIALSAKLSGTAQPSDGAQRGPSRSNAPNPQRGSAPPATFTNNPFQKLLNR